MKLNILKITTIIAIVFFMNSCKNYDELVKNPNLPSSVLPSFLLTDVLNTMGGDLAWTSAQEFNQFYISTYTYYGTNNYDQSTFLKSGTSFSYYLTLQNVVQMEIAAKNTGGGDVNPYAALGKFFRAYYFNLMSQKFGDIPVADALQGAVNPAPKYDSQKDLYIQMLQWLDDSNTMFNQLIAKKDATLSGDIYLGNSLEAWQKVVNSFTLRILISLSNQADDADLNIKQKFAAIVGNPAQYPLMTSIDDNLQFYYNASYNPYPKTPGNYKQTYSRENISATILNLTTSLKDPRTYIVGTPAPEQLVSGIYQITSGGTATATVTTKKRSLLAPAAKFFVGNAITIADVRDASGSLMSGYNKTATIQSVVNDSTFTYTVATGLPDIARRKGVVSKQDTIIGNAKKDVSDYTAYVGASPGDDMTTLGTNSQGGYYSFENELRYASTFDGSNCEPAIIIGYPELCFNIAEGINLGWATGSSSTWYTKGITASMNHLGIHDGAVITVGDNSQNVLGTVTVSLTNYLAQSSVQYQGDNATGLSQILTQKYIAFWQNSNWEAFFNHRRTGVPAFLVGAGTGNNQQLPLRWEYPAGEASGNPTNYKAAVQSQYNGADDLNGKMWILQ